MTEQGVDLNVFASLTLRDRPPLLDAWPLLAGMGEIAPVGADEWLCWSEAVPRVGMQVRAGGRVVKLVSMEERLHPALTVGHIRGALDILAAMPVRDVLEFRWTFSNVAIEPRDAASLLQRWVETGEPPVLSIIALHLEEILENDRTHYTHGLHAFVGHELAISLQNGLRSRDAAGLLAKVARHALKRGPIAVGARFAGSDGTQLIASSIGHRNEAIIMLNQVFQ